MADTAPIAAVTKPARRWFRFDLLDLFGMVTLACLSMGAVVALRDGPREDRAFLAIILSFTLVGIALGHNLRGTAILWAPVCAGFAGFCAMKISQTSWWLRQSADLFTGDTTYSIATWQAMMAASLLAAMIGLLVTLCYLLSLWLVRQGPSGVVRSANAHRIRAFVVLSAIPTLRLALWLLDCAYFGGGPAPYLITGAPRIPGTGLVSSPDGSLWAMQEAAPAPMLASEVWHFFEVSEGKLKSRFYFRDEISDAPSFSPDGRFFAYVTLHGNAFIRNSADGITVCAFDPHEPDEPIRNIRWLPDGQLVTTESNLSERSYSVWSFDGTELKLERSTKLGEDDFLMGFSPRHVVVAHGLYDAQKTTVESRKLADGQIEWRSEFDAEVPGYGEARLTSDGSFGKYDNWCLNLRTGESQMFLPGVSFGFTPRDFLLASRRPYMRFLSWELDVGPFANPALADSVAQSLWSKIPLGQRVLESLDYSQLVFIDPQTNKIVAKLGAVRGEILCAATSGKNQVVAAMTESYDADGVSDYRLYLWHMPAACR